MKKTILTVLVVGAAMGFAFRPSVSGAPWFWMGIAVPYALLGSLAVYELWDRGTLLDVLSPRWGDLSLGVLTAAALLLGSWAARAVLAPAGSPRLGWLYQIYAQVGDPDAIQQSILLTSTVLVIVALEELVWRSMVLGELVERFGARRGWPLAALLYGLTMVPTVFSLADPVAGPNPLLVTAALGCGIVWSFLAYIKRRLPPVFIAHAVFTYFSLVQFRWPAM